MMTVPQYNRNIKTIPSSLIKYLVYCILSVFMLTAPSIGAALDYTGMLDYIKTHYPPDKKIISSVEDVYQEKLVFEKPKKNLRQKQELLVLKKLNGQSRFVFPVKALIEIRSITNDKIAARVIKEFAGPIKRGDPITFPAAPKIFLSSNIEYKNDSSAYNSLVQALLSENLDVVELAAGSSIPDSDDYALHLSLNMSKQQLTAKIRSAYTRSTLYTKSYSLSEQIQVPPAPVPSNAGLKSPEPEIKDKSRQTFKLENQTAPSTIEAHQNEQQDFTKAAAPEYHEKIRLTREFQRMVAAELDGTPPKELVLLNQEGVTAFAWHNHDLLHLDSYRFQGQDPLGLHLHALDIDHDGTDEILATCGHKITYMEVTDTDINSIALDWQTDHFISLCEEIPFYLRVVNQPEGEKILLGQQKNGAEQYAGSIFKVNWNQQTKTLTKGPAYQPASEIHSLYQFNFAYNSKNRVLILEPDNFVTLYRLPEETLMDATDENFGPYHEIPYPVRLEKKKYLGEFKGISSKNEFAPRRFLLKKEFQNQCFLIQKGRATQGVKNKIFNFISPNKGTDRIVGLKYRSGQIYQTWESKPVPRDLIDFAFFEQKNRINLLALVRDSQGYALEVLAEKKIK